MKDFLEKLAALDAPLNPPAMIEDIRKAEDRLGLQLPPLFREMYRRFDGTSSEFGEMIWCIWRLEQLATIRQAYDHRNLPVLSGRCNRYPDQYVCFADTLFWAPVYAICADLNSPAYGEVVYLFGDTDFIMERSASSFERFLALFPLHFDDAVICEPGIP